MPENNAKNPVRKHIAGLMPYKAGKPIEETKRELGLEKVIKLASNENPLGPSPAGLAALKKSLKDINRYPDAGGFRLKRKLAQAYGLDPSCFVLGNGSDELIDTLVKTFVEEDENILTSEVTFLEYSIIGRTNKREVIQVPLKDFKFNLPAMAAKVNERTKLVFIANPNNPTGTYVGSKELNEFIASLPSGVLLVLDEAYDAYIDVKDFPRSLEYVKSGQNVILLKTFSKVYGLAGLRIGYAITRPELAQNMEKVRQPFNVNLLAQSAAEAALDDRAFLKKSRDTVIDGKEYICRQLKKMGIDYVPSVANFLLIKTPLNGVELFKRMLKKGVIVRDMEQYGLSEYVRVTIGKKAENTLFIKILKETLSSAGK